MSKNLTQAQLDVLKKRHYKLFEESLKVDDDLGCVLRGMVLVEAALREYIEDALPNPHALKNHWKTPAFGYENRMMFAAALGLTLDKSTIDALNILKTFRNDLAHKVGTELDEHQVNDLFGRLDPDLQNTVRHRMRNFGEKGWKKKLRQSLLMLVVHTEAIIGLSKPSFEKRVRESARKPGGTATL